MTASSPSPRVVRVLPDVAPLPREFDYLVPPDMDSAVRVGTIVRIVLHGRRVQGWVVADDVTPPPGVSLRPLAKVRGWGPAPEVIELATWAAWRWAGPRAALLRTASPELAVRNLPPPLRSRAAVAPGGDDGELLGEALRSRRAIVRLPPAADLLPVVLRASALGPALVVTPSLGQAEELARRLRSLGVGCAVVPRDWAQAAAGAPVVLGARAAAWAPCPGLRCAVVLDGHEEALQQEQAPTWNAWVVVAERARRARVPCLVATPCPSLEVLAWGRAGLHRPSRERERLGWAALEVVDRRHDDPRSGLYSPRLVGLLRRGGRVLCVLNRKGRVRLLACGNCGEVVRCERCGASVSLAGLAGETLSCPRCGQERPAVCLACGSMRLKALRIGVSRAREDLEQLAGREVGEVTADAVTMPDASVLVGTEAVLRRAGTADAVAFLDFDQELLAPRYRAAEEALALLALASRLVGGRSRSGRVMVQTRVPNHDAIVSALTADPSRLVAGETAVRAALALPPAVAAAVVSGSGGEEFVAGVAGLDGVEVLGPDGGRYLVKASDHEQLSRALAAAPRPSGRRLRVAVDPLRL